MVGGCGMAQEALTSRAKAKTKETDVPPYILKACLMPEDLRPLIRLHFVVVPTTFQ